MHPTTSLLNTLSKRQPNILAQSQQGEQFFEDIRPEDMNFVAAVWYAESCQVQDSAEADVEERRGWLTKVRRSLPACFCDSDGLI